MSRGERAALCCTWAMRSCTRQGLQAPLTGLSGSGTAPRCGLVTWVVLGEVEVCLSGGYPETAALLGQLIRACPHLVLPYVSPINSSLLAIMDPDDKEEEKEKKPSQPAPVPKQAASALPHQPLARSSSVRSLLLFPLCPSCA